MAFLIEKLTGEDATRRDDRRLTNFVRPMPTRPRDLFDTLAALGKVASFEGVIRGLTLQKSDPAGLAFVTLSRWLTPAELAEVPTPYKPREHLKQMLRSPEFRRSFVRRVLDAYPERRRLVHIGIPRSATAYVRAMAEAVHPVLPLDFGAVENTDLAGVFAVLGEALFRFPIASTIFLSAGGLAPLLYPPPAPAPAADPLHWQAEVPLLRATDLAFAVIRDPAEIVLGAVNAVLAGLAADPAGDSRAAARWRQRLEPPAGGREGAWKDLGRRVFDEVALRNPICTVLGDGSAEAALGACRISGLMLVGIGRLTEWLHTALSCEPGEPAPPAPRHLRAEDLDADQRTRLSEMLAEDRIFCARFDEKYAAAGIPAIRGRLL